MSDQTIADATGTAGTAAAAASEKAAADKGGADERTFTLPNRLQAESMTANLKHGLLLISIPKRDEVKPRHIAITAA